MLALTAIAIRVAAVYQLQQLLVTLDKVFVTQPATQLDARSLFFAYQPLFSTVLPQFFAAHLPLFAVQPIPLPATRPVSQLASQPTTSRRNRSMAFPTRQRLARYGADIRVKRPS